MKLYQVKCSPKSFEAILNNSKSYELRPTDFPYETGDHVRFMEWTGHVYTGREIEVKITFITRGNPLPERLCILGFKITLIKGLNKTAYFVV